MGEALRHPIRVRYNECDPQGHVFNGNYLAYFDLAITELWRGLGGYDGMVGGGIDMVVAEVRLRYLAPLGFDDEVELVIRSVSLGTTSMTTELAIERGGEVAAEGTLRHVFIEAPQGGKTPVPDEVRAGLEPFAP